CTQNSDDNGGLDAEGRYDAADDLLPVHRILARMAELHIMGGHGLVQDAMKAGYLFNDAGDAATKIREGQLAMRYYELAEEAWALLPEEE
ncbi:Eukaryotic elongation factor-2 kinase, partial [Cichlidogyrus casuarinus]